MKVVNVDLNGKEIPDLRTVKIPPEIASVVGDIIKNYAKEKMANEKTTAS